MIPNDAYGHLRKPTTVRLKPEVDTALRDEADKNKQTLNSEINERLERSLQETPLTEDTARALLESVNELIRTLKR